MKFATALHFYKASLRFLLALNLVFLVVMTGFRTLFYFLYRNPTAAESQELLTAFTLGVRFDLVILAYISIFPLLFLMLSVGLRQRELLKSFRVWAPWYYAFFLSLTTFISGIDIGYYSYFHDRINVLIWGFLRDDTWALVRTFWHNYPVLIIFALLGLWIFAIYKFAQWALGKVSFDEVAAESPSLASRLQQLVIFILPFFLVGIAARGTFGMYPLGPMHTQISADPFINHVPFNGPHALIRAIKLGVQQQHDRNANRKQFGYMDDVRKAFADFYQISVEQVPAQPLDLMKKKTPVNAWAAKTRPHVVMLVLEGWAAYWLTFQEGDFNLTQSFTAHLKSDWIFTHFIPGTGSTIGSLSNILIGSTQRASSPFLTESEMLQLPFRTSPASIYKKAGYTTRFLYAGNTGWRDVGKFASYQGYDHVEGEVELERRFGKNPDMLHDWGVHDELIFNYIEDVLKEATSPQFIVVMTTTNHPPYILPKTFQNSALKIPADVESNLVGDRDLIEGRFRSYQYTNQKLGDFLSRLKQSPQGERTIVAATGDHSFWVVNHSERQALQKYSVPFYLYVPKAGRPQKPDTSRFGSHLSLFPTIFELSLSDTEYNSLGTSMLDSKGPFYAANSNGLILSKDGGVVMLGAKGSFFNWQNSGYDLLVPAPATPATESMALYFRSLMSVLDYYYEKELLKDDP